MTDKNCIALNTLNREFYRLIAKPFSDTRNHPWPGWEKALVHIQKSAQGEALKVLDVGCGNGRFGTFLQTALEKKTAVEYLGIDAEAQLLSIAQDTLQDAHSTQFRNADIVTSLLLEEDLQTEALIGTTELFDCVACFGVLHHIPSYELRLRLVKLLLRALKPNGVLCLSLWQFDRAKRLTAKSVDTHEFVLEENDYILSWDKEVHALRYCHLCTAEEQNMLISESGAAELARFDADGREGNLNTYLVLTRG